MIPDLIQIAKIKYPDPSLEDLEQLVHKVRVAENLRCVQLCLQQDEASTAYRYDYRRGVLDCVDAIVLEENRYEL